MKANIIDDNHIIIVASEAECDRYDNHTRILIDSKDTFVCNSEPSSASYKISRPEHGSLFNVSLDISNAPFTTEEFLIIYLEMDDLTYPYVIPCFHNEMLLNKVAQASGIVECNSCDFVNNINNICPILLYYAFKLSLSVLDIRGAIMYWNRLFKHKQIKSNCNCHGN